MSNAPTGVLIANLGTPDAPTASAVRNFLGEFLSDRDVVDLHPLIWQPILRIGILPFRSRRLARLYRGIWTDRGSPLMVAARDLAQAMQVELTRGSGAQTGSSWRVAVGMRYGTPSIEDGVRQLRDQGCERVVLLPLFQQTCGATTGSIIECFREIVEDPLVVEAFGLQPAVIEHQAQAIEKARSAFACDHLVFSFHGIPERSVQAGETYPEQCREMAVALAEKLDLQGSLWTMAFQSRFGMGAWTGPSLIEVLDGLAHGSSRVLIAFPGFAADCLETLDEVGVGLRARFFEGGGAGLELVPCPGGEDKWAAVLSGLVLETTG